MNHKLKLPALLILVFSAFLFSCNTPPQATDTSTKREVAGVTKDPLPSWNEGQSKMAIIDFVSRTTAKGSKDFIPEADRIACFDNDGTLWSEQPMYFQLAFAMDRIKALAPQHPEWSTMQPFQAILEGDVKTALAGGEESIARILAVTHAGMTTVEFERAVSDWIAVARHPKSNKLYTDMIYQPMVEVLQYLRANGYKTFIVSGGGVDFMRPWAHKAYGIPADQVVGSSGKVTYEIRDGQPVLIKQAEINFIDDKEGKPVGIHQFIGKRPVFTAGNSDGDYAMLQWTSSATGYPRFGMIVHHTDEVREWAYDRASHIGKLDKGLDDAAKYNWLIVDMKKDWKTIYPQK